MEPLNGDESPHLPAPSLWPIGFAVGIACILVGLVVSPLVIAPIGGLLTLVFGFLWVRDATREYRGEPAHVEPEDRRAVRTAEPIPANEGDAALPVMEEEEVDRFPRSKFLTGATIGLGGVIGGLITVPALGFMVLPAFTGQETDEVDLGPLTNFEENQWMIATFFLDPEAGEVSRRTAYVRNNGAVDGKPNFTILSNRCVHLGCPVQPSGPVFDEEAKTIKAPADVQNDESEVRLIPTLPGGGFGCPCHGGSYDQEGNRTAGPPVRALDRYSYSIIDGRLLLGGTYSVSEVSGEGRNARIRKYKLMGPGEHVDGPEALFYPIDPLGR